MRIVKVRAESGCAENHPDAWQATRWEMFSAKVCTLENLQVSLPAAVESILSVLQREKLMGVKPDLFPLSVISDYRSKAIAKNHQENLALSPTFRRDEWQRNDAVAIACGDMMEKITEHFAGSAEEQPAPRENKPAPSIGKSPVTAARATPVISDSDFADFFPYALENCATGHLRAICERLLDELEARGEGDRWHVWEVPTSSAP